MNDYLKPLLRNNKALFLAYDHGFEHGPKDLINKSYDPSYILDLAVKGGYTAIILQKGVAEKFYFHSPYQRQIPLIIKVNGKTNLRQEEPYAPINCSVAYAKKLGAQAVGYTLYLGSKEENKMFEEFGRLQEEAHRLKMAAILWAYPRGENVEDELAPEILQYAARIGLELGADLIKIKYPRQKEVLKDLVRFTPRVPLVLSGGEFLDEEDFLQKVEEVIRAGFQGIAVGRNVWQRENPLEITKKIRDLLFGV